MSQTEAQLQRAVASVLDAIPGLLWQHTPNEGRRSAAHGARLKRHGLKPGVPDVQIYLPPRYYPHHGIALELKVGRAQPTAAQLWWLTQLEARGWRVAVCRTVTDVLDILTEEGVL